MPTVFAPLYCAFYIGLTCNDGQRVFENSGKYLCYSSTQGRWMMTDSVCSLGPVVSSSTSGDVLKPSYWMVNTGGTNYQQSHDIYISDCGSNGGFTDLDCWDNNAYQDEICISTNTSWWQGEQTFEVYDQLCSHDKPVYRLIVELNETTTIGFNGAVVDATVQEIFYVHYQPDYLLVTDNKTTPQWMVSKNEISVEYIAVCQQEDLMKCTASKWKRKVTQIAEDDLNGIVLDLLDSFMTVSDGACGSSLTEENTWSSTETVVVALVIILALTICVSAFFIWRRMNMADSIMIKEAVNSGQYSLMATNTAGAEPELVMEVEADNHITTTRE